MGKIVLKFLNRPPFPVKILSRCGSEMRCVQGADAFHAAKIPGLSGTNCDNFRKRGRLTCNLAHTEVGVLACEG
jgi:hypothetical protein